MTKPKKKKKTVMLDVERGQTAYEAGMIKFEELIRTHDKYITNDQMNVAINAAAEQIDRFVGQMFPNISVAAATSLFGYVAANGLAKSIIAGVNTQDDAKAVVEIFYTALVTSLPTIVEAGQKAKEEGKLGSSRLIIP